METARPQLGHLRCLSIGLSVLFPLRAGALAIPIALAITAVKLWTIRTVSAPESFEAWFFNLLCHSVVLLG